MSKKKNRQKNRVPVNYNKVEPSLYKKIKDKLTYFINVYTLIAGLFGVTIWQYIFPEVDLKTTGTLNEKDPFLTLTVIRNNSKLPIYNAHQILLIDKILLLDNTEINNSSLNLMDFYSPVIKPSESFTCTYRFDKFISEFPRLNQVKVKYANIAYAVNYTYLGFERTQLFFLKCFLDANGKAVWIDMPEQPFAEKILEDRKSKKISNEFRPTPKELLVPKRAI